MIIYVLRHGQAEPQVTTDDARCLTPRGVEETQKVLANRLEPLLHVKRIIVSPLVRAQQTAQLAKAKLPNAEWQTTDLLVPEANPQQLIDWLGQQKFAANDAVLLVSHQPLVGSLLALFTGRAEGFYPMNTSSLAALEMDICAADMAQMRWLDHANS